MDFLKKIFSPSPPAGKFYEFTVTCKRCGETVPGRINIYNEPGMEINENGRMIYSCRKVLIGDGHCFQQIEVVIKFDENRHVIDRKIIGGEFQEN